MGTWNLTGFNSLEFVLLFLPSVLILHRVAIERGGVRAARWSLLIASIIFYVLSSAVTLPIVAASFLLNFWSARRVTGDEASRPRRRRALVLAISANVILLGLLKYSRFAAETLAALGIWQLRLPSFALPLGVSFFTLQQIMYLVDCFEGIAAPMSASLHALFMGFFAYVSAGPLVRCEEFVPQLEARSRLSDERFATGLVRFVTGLGKKVVLAGALAAAADDGFARAGGVKVFDGWMAALSYTFQLYFDFSGYTDMALGAALMLGLVLPENFEGPLEATSIIEFWKRWHITLSRFITSYLYTPMARAATPLTFKKAMVITLVAMTIVGLWHGAAWTFVLFGFLHGAALVANNVWRKRKKKLARPVAWMLTFGFVLGAFIVFRADSVGDAIKVVAGMLGTRGLGFPDWHGADQLGQLVYRLVPLGIGFATLRMRTSSEFAKELRPSWRYALTFAAVLTLCLVYLNSGTNKGFIYREF